MGSVTFDQVRFKQAHSNKKSKMKMLKYTLPLMLIAVTTTSAFSLGSLFHSEDNAEDIEALDEAEDFVEEEEQEEEFDEEVNLMRKMRKKQTMKKMRKKSSLLLMMMMMITTMMMKTTM